MDFRLPECVTGTPAAPVALVGLDVDSTNGVGRHAEIWKSFTSEKSPDRVPLKFYIVKNFKFPISKPRRTSYEWFIPKGILKSNWIDKHLNQLPSVVIIFFELDWNDPDWNEKMLECASRVESVRTTLAGRGTKIAVVLIQKEPASALPTTESTASSERAAGLCSACELSARSLFVLPMTTQNLSGFVVRLENAFYELAQNYYHQEIRGIKSHRDYLNKTTHLYLFVRHQFKIGFLNELKRDLHTAYKHYQQAYNLLMEVRATDTNIVEVKTVAGIINYKFCRLAFKLNLPRDAISQFRRHMDIFKSKIGPGNLSFEHYAWQSEQCETFARIFHDAIHLGLPAIQTQHPGLYYQQAAQHAIKRRQISDELCLDANDYPDPDPLEGLNTLEFYGQRPWRPGKVSIEPPDMQLEGQGIKALLYKENHLDPSHTVIIVDLLKKAIEQNKLFRLPRSVNNLTVQMAEELTIAKQFEEALELLKPVIVTYRRDGWSLLLKTALSLALKCAYLIASFHDYIQFALELALLTNVEESKRVAANLCKLLGDPVKIPSVEPGMTSKSERALVGLAAQKWCELMKNTSLSTDIELLPELSNRSLIQVKSVFQASSFKADEQISFDLCVKNRSPQGDDESCTFSIQEVTVFVSCKGSDEERHRLHWSCDGDQLMVKPGETVVKTFTFSPSQDDVGKVLVVKKVIVASGTNVVANIHFHLPFDKVEGSLDKGALVPISLDDTDETDAGKSFSKAVQVHVEGRQPLLQMTIDAAAPILVGEWFLIKINLLNNENVAIEDVKVCTQLKDADDPIIADTTTLTVDYQLPEPQTPQTPISDSKEFGFTKHPETKVIDNIQSNETKSAEFYLRCSTVGDRRVQIQVSYPFQNLTVEFGMDETFPTVQPFEMTTEFKNCKGKQPLVNAFTDEPFLLLPRIKSLSNHHLTIADTWLEVRSPVQQISNAPSLLKSHDLYKDSFAGECFVLMIKKDNLLPSRLDVQDLGVGKYVIKWQRSSTDATICATTIFDLPTVKVNSSSLFVSLRVSSYGVVRTPLKLKYTLLNKTSRVQEFAAAMHLGEAFMFSGNKQLHIKILPKDHQVLNFILYPLIPGEAVQLPQLKLTSTRVAMVTEDLDAVFRRLVTPTITVLPKTKLNSNKDTLPLVDQDVEILNETLKCYPTGKGVKQKLIH